MRSSNDAGVTTNPSTWADYKAALNETDDAKRKVITDKMQNELYELAKKVGLVNADGKPSRDAFTAIYLAFIGKPNGPRAAWMLVALDPAFVRAADAVMAASTAAA